MPRLSIRLRPWARRSTSSRWKRSRRTPTNSASSDISICRRQTARRSCATGGNGPACSASASPSISRSSRAGGPTAASIGSGPPVSARNCRSASSRAATWRRSARSPSGIPGSNCTSIISGGAVAVAARRTRTPSPICRRCLRSRNSRMSRSRCRARRAIRAIPTPTATSTAIFTRFSTRSGRRAASGAPTSRACRAATANA